MVRKKENKPLLPFLHDTKVCRGGDGLWWVPPSPSWPLHPPSPSPCPGTGPSLGYWSVSAPAEVLPEGDLCPPHPPDLLFGVPLQLLPPWMPVTHHHCWASLLLSMEFLAPSGQGRAPVSHTMLLNVCQGQHHIDLSQTQGPKSIGNEELKAALGQKDPVELVGRVWSLLETEIISEAHLSHPRSLRIVISS